MLKKVLSTLGSISVVIGSLAIIIIFIAAFVGGPIYSIVTFVQGMYFQQTHPHTQATVTHVFETTETRTGGNNNTYTVDVICADTVSFFANGQTIEVNVQSLRECGVNVGDKLTIAYDPQRPSQLEFIPAGGPVWGNVIGIICFSAFLGFVLAMGLEWWFGDGLFRRLPINFGIIRIIMFVLFFASIIFSCIASSFSGR